MLFLGDCMYASPRGLLTRELAFPLYEAILAFGVERYVEGHHPSVVSRHEMELLVEKMHVGARAAAEGGAIATSDEDTSYFFGAFAAAARR